MPASCAARRWLFERREYVLAARGLGYGHLRIMFRHILPNVLAPAFVFAMSDFVLDVQLGATLSFFGLGVQPPTAEWGLMIAETRSFMLTAPWTVVFPGPGDHRRQLLRQPHRRRARRSRPRSR